MSTIHVPCGAAKLSLKDSKGNDLPIRSVEVTRAVEEALVVRVEALVTTEVIDDVVACLRGEVTP